MDKGTVGKSGRAPFSMAIASSKTAVPLKIEFFNDQVRFKNNANDEYKIANSSFKIEQYAADLAVPSCECA